MRLHWLFALLVACGGAGGPVLVPDPARTPPSIRQACARAEVRCSSCHTLDRLVSGPSRTPLEWQRQVTRMRLMPASGITTTDADEILQCLLYREQRP
jgi:hypothetical protein